MFHRLWAVATAFGVTMVSVPASASPAAPTFEVPAVSDQVLREISGTASPYAPLSRSNFADLAEAQSRGDVRLFGSIASLQMDAWWGTIGSELIANAIRNQP